MKKIHKLLIGLILFTLLIHIEQLPNNAEPVKSDELERIDYSAHSFSFASLNGSNYIIITIDACESILSSFIQWQKSKGFTPAIFTVSDISMNYDGYDLPAKIRMFLRDAFEINHQNLTYALCIGNTTDIPMRLISQDKGYDPLYTDFYYAELSLPDDRSWDSDQDYQYGERDDDMDLVPEIIFGRIPFSNPLIVSRIFNQTIAFEQNNDSTYKHHMLLMGAFFWNDTDNAALLEAIQRNPVLSDWTATTLYEKNDEYFSSYSCDFPLTKHEVSQVWSSKSSSFVNWVGHGTPVSVHLLGENKASFLSTHDLSWLQMVDPCIIFANACNNANPSYPNLGVSFMEQCAIGFIGPATTSQAEANWHDENDGSSQSFNYFFSDFFLSGKYTFGQAHQQALQKMIDRNLWYDTIYETLTWGTIYGIPDVSINAIGLFPTLQIEEISGGNGISFSLGNKGLAPAENVSWTVSITGGRYLKQTQMSGMIQTINMHESIDIHIPIFGWGLGYFSSQPIITITADKKGIDSVQDSVKANIIGSYVQLI